MAVPKRTASNKKSVRHFRRLLSARKWWAYNSYSFFTKQIMMLNKSLEPFLKNQTVYFQEELKFMWTQKEVLIALHIKKLFFYAQPELRLQIKPLRDKDTYLIICVNSQLEQWLRKTKIMLPSIFWAKLFYFFSVFLFIFVVALWWEADKWLATRSLLEKGKGTDRLIKFHWYKKWVAQNL